MFTPDYQRIADLEFGIKDSRQLSVTQSQNSTEYNDMQYFWFLYKDHLLKLSIDENE